MDLSLAALVGALAAAVAAGFVAARVVRGLRPLMAAAAALLALAATGPRLPSPGGAGAVLLLDVSWSSGIDEIDPLPALRAAGVDPEAARVVVFGATPVLLPAGATAAERNEAMRRAGRGGSDAAAGLRAAGALLPAGGEVVLATDGRVEERPAAEAALALRAAGVGVRVVPHGRPRAEESWLRELSVPGRVAPRASALATIAMAGPPGETVAVRLLLQGVDLGERLVPLPASGAAVLRWPLPAADPGYHEVTAILPARGDCRENDRLVAGLVVGGPPRALLVNAGALAAPLRESGFEVAEREGPEDPSEFDLVVLRDVPASRLPDGGKALADHVSAGGGLAVLGGPRAFGPGGWQGIPLESCLPVTCAPAGEGFLAILLLDRSGTMSEPFEGAGETRKILAARAAAERLVAALPADAHVLLVPFTAEPLGDAKPADLGTEEGRRRIAEALAALTEASGGTALAPPLLLAAEAAREAERFRSLVLLVTDGRLEGEGAESVLGAAAALRRTGARLNVLAVGADADRDFLGVLAGAASGVAQVGRGGELAAAFLDALVAAEGEGRVLLGPREVVRGPGPSAAELPVPPAVEGLVRTWARPEAEVLFSAGEGLPLAAVRRHGLGRSLAVTTDPLSGWAPGWEAGGHLLRLLSMVRRPAALAGPRAEVVLRGGVPWIRVDLPETSGTADGVLERPGLAPLRLRFVPAEGGVHEAPAGLPGPCAARLRIPGPGGGVDVGIGIPGPEEYAGSGPDEARLARLAAALGGAEAPPPVRRDARAVPALLALALLVLDRAAALRARIRLKRSGRPGR